MSDDINSPRNRNLDQFSLQLSTFAVQSARYHFR
jgi:hypothetical protein